MKSDLEVPELTAVRKEIDEIDTQLLDLLSSRKELVNEVTKIKSKLGLEARQPKRYRQLLNNLKERGNKIGVDSGLIDEIWDAIHQDSQKKQNKKLLKSRRTAK